MIIRKGTTRSVYIFPKFVIKLPIIHFRRGMKKIYTEIKRKTFFANLKGYKIEQWNTPKHLLCKGLVDNWREYIFYRNNRKLKILVPTIFSFFGLVNIQKQCEKLIMGEEEFFSQLCDLSKREVWSDNHTFSNINNFGVIDGKIKILDYGSIYVQMVLEKYGDKIYNGVVTISDDTK